jgi:SM-20-related protein
MPLTDPMKPALKPPEPAPLLVFGAHPDDIEFGCGAVIARETRSGRRAHFVVCSRGEAGTYGTPKQRTVESKKAAALLAGIGARGYAEVRDASPAAVIAPLRQRALALNAAGALRPAAVGRARSRREHAALRGDRIAWLDDQPRNSAEQAALALFEDVRRAGNLELLLGLFSFESHYAFYPPGASYARHRDRFRDDDRRVLSCVLYLNDGWTRAEGGALRLHLKGSPPHDVLPEGGTLVAFLSAEFEHEVLPATRDRLALTGWLLQRGAAPV